MARFGWGITAGKEAYQLSFNDVLIMNVDYTGFAFFDATPVAQQAHIADLTSGISGSGDDTLVAVSGTGDDAVINNNFRDLIDKYNALKAVLEAYGLTADS